MQFTEEHKQNISEAHKGVKLSEEHKRNISKNNIDQRGDKNHNYRGGRKAAIARRNAKRKELCYTLLMPLAEGEVGHHVTDEEVIGVPKEVHERFSGYTRKKHRTLVLQWLKANDKKKYIKVLCVLAKEAF